MNWQIMIQVDGNISKCYVVHMENDTFKAGSVLYLENARNHPLLSNHPLTGYNPNLHHFYLLIMDYDQKVAKNDIVEFHLKATECNSSSPTATCREPYVIAYNNRKEMQYRGPNPGIGRTTKKVTDNQGGGGPTE